MLCKFCRTERVENGAPCPHCGAPSPLGWNTQFGQRDQQPSLLPVPYHGGGQRWDYSEYQAQENALQVIPLQETAHLVSALPAQPEEYGTVHIPPMYTNPRAIIPRYRIISGFISVLIVFALLCTGAGYYAKASGRLNYLRRITGAVLPPNLHPASTPALSDPPDRVDQGPAYLIIPSAIITAHVDPKDLFFALKSDTVFKPGQTFYVIYSVHPKTKGLVVIKWYTNGVLYTTASSPIGAGANVTGKAAMQYAKPAEGSVELYWNNELAQKLYFVVR